MKEDFIFNALSKLYATDERLGPYLGHLSTTKGVTLSTPQGDYLISASFLSQLLYQPEIVTKERLLQIVQLK